MALLTPHITRARPGRYQILDSLPCPRCGPARPLLNVCAVCGAIDVEYIKNDIQVDLYTNQYTEQWRYICPHDGCCDAFILCTTCFQRLPICFFIVEPNNWLIYLGIALAIAGGLYWR
jgi:hypothetical protein